MNKYYSLREIAQELQIPKSTIVKYKDYFTEFLPFVGEGKRKKLSEEGMELLREIRDLRENANLDWTQIRELLTERARQAEAPQPPPPEPQAPPRYAEQPVYVQQQYAAQPPPQTTAVAVQAPGRQDEIKAIRHLNHMIYTLAGELVQSRRQVSYLSRKIEDNSSQIRALQTANTRASHELTNLHRLVSKVDNKNRKRLEVIIEYMRSEFQRVNVGVARAAKRVDKKPEDTETLTKLNDKIERVIEDAAMYQARYALLKRENQVLRKKLEGAPAKQPDTRGGTGWKDIFKRGR